jgi:hypothetical protein
VRDSERFVVAIMRIGFTDRRGHDYAVDLR